MARMQTVQKTKIRNLIVDQGSFSRLGWNCIESSRWTIIHGGRHNDLQLVVMVWQR